MDGDGEKKDLDFGPLFSKSWREYKTNFKTIFLVSLLFIAILGFMTFLIAPLAALSFSIPMILTIGALVVLITAIIFIGYFAGIIGVVSKGGEFTFGDVFKEGKENFFRITWYGIVIGFFLLILYLLLIIPGIIFSVFWVVAVYAYYERRKGVLDSLGTSKRLVSGRWFRTWIQLILITFICFVSVEIIFSPLEVSLFGLAPEEFDAIDEYSLGRSILGLLQAFVSFAFSYPLSFFFTRNMYLGLKNLKSSSTNRLAKVNETSQDNSLNSLKDSSKEVKKTKTPEVVKI